MVKDAFVDFLFIFPQIIIVLRIKSTELSMKTFKILLPTFSCKNQPAYRISEHVFKIMVRKLQGPTNLADFWVYVNQRNNTFRLHRSLDTCRPKWNFPLLDLCPRLLCTGTGKRLCSPHPLSFTSISTYLTPVYFPVWSTEIIVSNNYWSFRLTENSFHRCPKRPSMLDRKCTLQ